LFYNQAAETSFQRLFYSGLNPGMTNNLLLEALMTG
jgi:hypothetical protein